MNTDTHGRTIDYLRISVTDRCNERCLYCMPEGYKGWARKPDHLTAEEIIRVVAVAADLGFQKFRLTGGEPLLRPDITTIVSGIRGVPGVRSLDLSTNGTRLAPLASALRAAGVDSLNVSLDAWDPARYRHLTGGDREQVLEGLRAARSAGFYRTKLNTVLLQGENEGELAALAEFAAEWGHPLRLIELMPLSREENWVGNRFLPVAEAIRILGGPGAFQAHEGPGLGHGPAVYHRHLPTGALVGFIGVLTRTDFCAACNKLRLTADGRLRPCLGRNGETDLLPALRSGTETQLRDLFLECLQGKPKDHLFNGGFERGRPMVAIGG
jgi:GTP 3',8-cyclase